MGERTHYLAVEPFRLSFPNIMVVIETKMFIAGGVAGSIARTCTAPLDRIKLLFQVQNSLPSTSTLPPSSSTATISTISSRILREEGFFSFWRGNLTNIIRVFPYSAAQLMANDAYKRQAAVLYGDTNLPISIRLACGALAGMTATALTHPLDTLRLRLALPGAQAPSLLGTAGTILRTEGIFSFYRGLLPTLAGIAPYAAMNFALYDEAKRRVYSSRTLERDGGERGRGVEHPLLNLLIGSATGMVAASVCYPLDTVRRRMQMKEAGDLGSMRMMAKMWSEEGMRAFYKGWGANVLKVVPQNGIRFVSYELIKDLLGVQKKKTDT